MLANIFETQQVLGGLREDECIVLATSNCSPRKVITAIATSCSRLVLRRQEGSRVQCCIIPWNQDPRQQPAALALSPTADNLLVAVTDGSLYVVPLNNLWGDNDSASAKSNPSPNKQPSADEGARQSFSDDATRIPSSGSRSKPAAVVWWQPSSGTSQFAIVGTVLGELCIIELSGGKEVGGTYIPRPVESLSLCTDNAMDMTYLLITDVDKSQFRLVLEQKSVEYLFPLESPLTGGSEGAGYDARDIVDSSLIGEAVPRSRLKDLKQISVEKLQLLRRSLSDAKQKASNRRSPRPPRQNKGVDTAESNTDTDGDTTLTPSVVPPTSPPPADESNESSSDSPSSLTSTSSTYVHPSSRRTASGIVPQRVRHHYKRIDLAALTGASSHTEEKDKEDTTSTLPVYQLTDSDECKQQHSTDARDGGAVESRCATNSGTCDRASATLPSSSPEPLSSWLGEVFCGAPCPPHASPQYSNDRYLLTLLCPATHVLRVYSAEVSSAPLYVYKLIKDVKEVLVLGELLYCTNTKHPNRLTVVASLLASSNKMDGEISSKANHVLETLDLPLGEEIIKIFPCPQLISPSTEGGSSSCLFEDYDAESIDIELTDLPVTLPTACMIVTKTGVYISQTRSSVERLFLECVLQSSELESGNRLGAVFSLDSKLYEVAADAKLKTRKFSSALALYKQARCPHARCALKFAWAGLVPQFLTYTSKLLSSSGTPQQQSQAAEVSAEEKRHLASLTVMAYLVQLCNLKSGAAQKGEGGAEKETIREDQVKEVVLREVEEEDGGGTEMDTDKEKDCKADSLPKQTNENEAMEVSSSESTIVQNSTNSENTGGSSSQCSSHIKSSNEGEKQLELSSLSSRKVLTCAPREVAKVSPSKSTLATLLLFLKNNQHYDPLLCLCLAAHSWRWETLQYLSATRGLLLEKLSVLLCSSQSSLEWLNEGSRVKNSATADVISESVSASTPGSMESDSSASSSKKKASTSFSLMSQYDQVAKRQRQLCRDNEAGYLHCFSDPELRSVLLVSPKLSELHFAKTEALIPSLSDSVLARLASLYDPSHHVIIPFLTHAKLKELTLVFLRVIAALNAMRATSYKSELLEFVPSLPTIEKLNVSSSIATSLSPPPTTLLCCGFGSSAMVCQGRLYTWGCGEGGVLGHGLPLAGSVPSLPLSALMTEVMELCEGTDSSNAGDGSAVKESTVDSNTDGGAGQAKPVGIAANIREVREPKLVKGLSHCKTRSVACGRSHMLALTDQGVYGWGGNNFGQVGLGGTSNHPRPTLLTARVLFEEHRVIHVACGQYHSMAVTDTGRLYTWGWGVHGQLGHGTIEDCHTPTLVTALKDKHIVTAGGGYAHTACLDSDGNVYSWGCGVYGQCGNGSLHKLTTPRGVNLPVPVTHLAIGYFHCVCVTKDHEVYSWGSNPTSLRVQAQLQKRAKAAAKQEQLKLAERGGGAGNTLSADDSTIERKGPPTPVMVYYDPEPSPTDERKEAPETAEEASEQSNMEESGVKKVVPAVEINSHDESKTVQEVKQPNINGGLVPSLITPPPSPRNAASDQQSPQAPKKNQEGLLWSRSIRADSNTVPSCDPGDIAHLTPKLVSLPSQWGTCAAVSAGSQHSALLTTHGALYMWGRNLSGQLGTGSRQDSLQPVRVLEDSVITNVRCGSDFTIATDNTGQTWGFGSNYFSQLGRMANSGGEKAGAQPPKVFTLRTAKRVLKVPQSMHSNVETPRVLSGIPSPTTPGMRRTGPEEDTPSTPQTVDPSWLRSLQLQSIEENSSSVLQQGVIPSLPHPPLRRSSSTAPPLSIDESYGPLTLHCALHLLAPYYDAGRVASVLESNGCYQALATLHSIRGDHCSALRYNIQAVSARREDCSAIEEAVRVVHLSLQRAARQDASVTRALVRQAMISFSSHRLPVVPLEELLLNKHRELVNHMAVILFSDNDLQSKMSLKFCIEVCTSVISQLMSVVAMEERIISQLMEEQFCHPTTTEGGTPATELLSEVLKRHFLPSSSPDGGLQFKCGHSFSSIEQFTQEYLPRLSADINSVGGVLGKTAMVLVKQYSRMFEGESREEGVITEPSKIGCPHCLLTQLGSLD